MVPDRGRFSILLDLSPLTGKKKSVSTLRGLYFRLTLPGIFINNAFSFHLSYYFLHILINVFWFDVSGRQYKKLFYRRILPLGKPSCDPREAQVGDISFLLRSRYEVPIWSVFVVAQNSKVG